MIRQAISPRFATKILPNKTLSHDEEISRRRGLSYFEKLNLPGDLSTDVDLLVTAEYCHASSMGFEAFYHVATVRNGIFAIEFPEVV